MKRINDEPVSRTKQCRPVDPVTRLRSGMGPSLGPGIGSSPMRALS
jgi:hypothetical protein